jgi:ABC-type thiamine transport system substrate-binding protein
METKTTPVAAPTLNQMNDLESQLHFTKRAIELATAVLPIRASMEITIKKIKLLELAAFAAQHQLPMYKGESFEEYWTMVIKDCFTKGCNVTLSTLAI